MKLEGIDDDAIVISGISGKFPNSNNINELMENLLCGKDCVAPDSTRWKLDDDKISSRIGLMSEIMKFDNVFFGVNGKQANHIDPTARLTMEATIEAAVDAGLNNAELRNSKSTDMKLEGIDDDAIVISGISGKFPNSNNINELMENLLCGKDCVAPDSTRWKLDDDKISSRIGLMSEIMKFDNVFFGVNGKQANHIDPTARLTMEATIEAAVDAGLNNAELRNSKSTDMKLEGIDDDAIVISGISGKFPNSNNINELMENLLCGKDCVAPDSTRWKLDDDKISSRIGLMSEIMKFDNVFFGVNGKQANHIDPTARLTMEATLEAVIDGGLNPAELRNSKTNIYAASTISESDKSYCYEKLEQSGLNLLGASHSMMSNRISFVMNTIGSSCTIDGICSSSAIAFQKAYEALKNGDCDYAIVTTGIVSLHQQTSYHFTELGLLSPDGFNRSFDDKANGFSRSESVGTILLQRVQNAKRIYAEVINSMVMFDNKAIERNTCLFPTAEFQAQIMKQTLKHCSLEPSDITYIEADGTAIKIMDREELKAIDLVYGKDRNLSNPLLIGSIKSNIGHTFNCNTVNSIIKVLIAMEKGVIPPNLYYDEPPVDAECLLNGRVKVVTKPTPWTDGYAAINTAAINGSFSHIILKRYSKEKQKRELSSNNMPRLFVASCRTQEMISSIFNVLKQNRGDDELAQFINDITKKPFPHSLYSGYTVIPELEEANSEESISFIQDNVLAQSRQIWFIFSGMGSQWTGMGESLMKIPIFAEAIKKCDVVLRPRGYDIVHIICDKDPSIYENIINCFIGIAAIQIGLVDILYAVGVEPNYMIGHSAGELGCSYADGCFTLEEMILSALSRGLASVESDLIHGTMAAVGLGYKHIQNLCPEDIDVACHNGPESSTISGPTESINAFVEELKQKGIFAKTVPTSNIAYHSRYISPAGPKVLDYLKKVIEKPKSRSKRWISTSIPKNEWYSKKSRLSSAEYHTNNLLSSVLFEEVLEMIPKNAITIEISPHGLLQGILRTSLDSNCINLSLTKRGNKDNTTLILTTLGKLYNLGCPIMPGKLYPKVPYPIYRGTPSISSLVRWEHSNDWFVNYNKSQHWQEMSEKMFHLNLESEEYKFLQDFKINENVIIPTAIYLHFVENTYSRLLKNQVGKYFIFENIIVHNFPLQIPTNSRIKLIIMIFKGSGKFEVKTIDSIMLATGTICSAETTKEIIPEVKEEMETLRKEDIYTNLLLRGYEYGESYKIIDRLSASCSNSTFKWSTNWMFILEGLIQVHIINSRKTNILMPSRIRKLTINMEEFQKGIEERNTLPIKFEQRINLITGLGIEMIGIEFKEMKFNRYSKIIADELRFIPNKDNETKMNMEDVCNVVIGLILKNIIKYNTTKIMVTKESKHDNENILLFLESTLRRINDNYLNIKLIDRELLNETLEEHFILIIINNAHFDDVKKFINTNSRESFILTIIKTEDEANAIATLANIKLNIILKMKMPLRRIALLLQKERKLKTTVVTESQENFIDQLKISLRDSNYDNVIFLIRNIIDNDIFGILQNIKREPGYKKLQIFELQDPKAPRFSLQSKFYQNQVKLNLSENVLSPNYLWGSYIWMPLPQNFVSASRWHMKIEKPDTALKWIEASPLIKEKNPNLIKIEFAAIDLNIYEYWLKNDVSLESEITITEYSGTDENGRRVMGLVDNFTVTNEVSSDPDFTWVIPDNLNFEEAATMPQAYLAAFCILYSNTVQFTTMKSLLIHFGASDVGQALINISLSYNFNVYTTYETEAEKRIIESMRPRLPESHIINVNNYQNYILNITKGEGIDFIVASYSTLNDMEPNLKLLKKYSHLVMVYDNKQINNNSMGMKNLLKYTSIYSYCLQDLFKLSSKKRIDSAKLMRTALQTGTLKPIISRRLHLLQETTKEMEIETCKRYGKVLINLQERLILSNIIPHFYFCSNKCYFIVGGLNSFGKVMIEWMIEQGVKKLFIVSYQSIRDYENWIYNWRESGATVIVRNGIEMSEPTSFYNLLKEAASSLGLLDGIFDLQRTAIDPSISSQKYFEITKLLDKDSRKLCASQIKFFIFSLNDLDGDILRDPRVEKLCIERKESGLHGLFVLLADFVEKTYTETRSEIIYYKKISTFLQRLNTLLSTDALVIAVRYIITEHFIGDNKTNIVTIETNEEQQSNGVDLQENKEYQFEKYLYNPEHAT